METAVKKLYEAMFLVDSALASDWDEVVKTIEKILKRSDAEMVSIRNWAERKLAYEIDHKSRATYVLCFFRADGYAIPKIENDVHLSEQILRVLILSTEPRDEKDIEKDMHGTPDEKQLDLEDTDQDLETQREDDEEDDTESLEEHEEDDFRQPAVHDILDAIEPKLPPETEPADAIEPQPFETEKDQKEKDAAD